MKRMVCVAVCAVFAAAITARAGWITLLSDSFDGSTISQWSYQGATNTSGQSLFRCFNIHELIQAEWDQSNCFSGFSDPYVILPSSLSRSLGRTLTDRDTFRISATLNITPGSVPDTTEFYQIANFGLYNLAETGPDRTMSDNWSGNSSLLKDACDFVEFNYFINNDSGGFNPGVSATIGAHTAGLDGDYTTGSSADDTNFWHDTDMGVNHWLPEGSNLYVELTYYGGETNTLRRRALCTIYSDAAHSDVLSVNGVDMFYWTQPLPEEKHFSVKEAAFVNYAASNWGGENGFGQGTYDDLRVEQYFAPGEFFAEEMNSDGFRISFASESGTVYQVESSSDLHSGWSPAAAVTSVAETVTFTNSMPDTVRFYRVTK